ncbi:MAG: TonB-dependent receptor, partial [Blastocatellia bacterium]|nr:TonB-dependent receptor [Blastocatellia bacterium]
FSYDLSWFRGSHNLTFGGMYKRIQFNPNVSATKRGQFTFTGAYTGDAFGDFLLGLPFNARGGAGSTQVYLRGNETAAFVQDDWKAAKRLTLNLGLRYEYASPFSEKYNRWSTLDVELGQVVVASDDNGRTYPQSLWVPGIEQRLAPLPIVTSEAAGLERSLASKDLNNFAPRFGFAFDLFGNQRTVIRGGYGIFYNVASYNALTLQSLAGPFFSSINANNSATAPAPIQTILSNPMLGTPGWASYDINFHTPYYQQWNFGIQRLLTRDLLVEAQYLGSKGTKLYTNIYFNVPDPSPTNMPPIAARSRYPTLGNNTLQASAGKSNYDALVLRAEKRLSSGLMVMGSYTFSKSIDLDSLAASVASSNLDESNMKSLERGLSSFDVRHRFVASFTYNFPFKFKRRLVGALLKNWQAGGIITQQSGLPFTVNITSDRANNGLLNQRPNLVGDPNLPADERTPERWFNTDAFVVQPVGTLGTAGRDILEGPGTSIVDFSLLKNIPFSDRHRLQFRAEFFNLFNHANFDVPERFCAGTVTGAPCTAPQFGRIDAARDPRVLQFGLKYLF